MQSIHVEDICFSSINCHGVSATIFCLAFANRPRPSVPLNFVALKESAFETCDVEPIIAVWARESCCIHWQLIGFKDVKGFSNLQRASVLRRSELLVWYPFFWVKIPSRFPSLCRFERLVSHVLYTNLRWIPAITQSRVFKDPFLVHI